MKKHQTAISWMSKLGIEQGNFFLHTVNPR